ncbi:MAG: diguanylate cyclase, partial [Actinobacteria bacterium]|nr:diguanylate cyclase [Actinomycetota bacterium]
MSPSLASAPALIVADEVALGVAIAGGAVLLVLALGWWSSHRELTGRSRDPARHLLDALPEAVMEVDSTGRILVVNRSACALLGREVDDLVGVDADTVLVDADQGVLADWLAMDVTSSDGGEIEHVALEARVERPDGAHVEVAITVHHGADDTLLLRWTDRARGVEEREALDQARHRFQQAFQSAPTGMALVRLDDGRIVDANQSLADMLERSVVDLVGRTLREFTHPDDVRQAQPHRARLELGLVDSYRLDQRFRRRDNSWVWARTRVSVSEDDGVLLAINHIEDVTEQRRTAEQLQHAARHDELTRLPNRAYLMSILEQRLAGAQPSAVGILFIDLDHFKVVNDSLGHVIGDELLQEVSRRLQTAVREGDVLARFGGDEFVVVLDGRGRAVDAA